MTSRLRRAGPLSLIFGVAQLGSSSPALDLVHLGFLLVAWQRVHAWNPYESTRFKLDNRLEETKCVLARDHEVSKYEDCT